MSSSGMHYSGAAVIAVHHVEIRADSLRRQVVEISQEVPIGADSFRRYVNEIE
jgi:hypothetical protein